MNNFSYDLSPGVIGINYRGGDPHPDEILDGHSVLLGEADGNIHYVDLLSSSRADKASLSLVADKSSIAADGVDVATITGIPAGVSVSLNGAEPVEVTDGEVVFTSLDEGEHSLVFTGIPYLPTEVTIAAV